MSKLFLSRQLLLRKLASLKAKTVVIVPSPLLMTATLTTDRETENAEGEITAAVDGMNETPMEMKR